LKGEVTPVSSSEIFQCLSPIPLTQQYNGVDLLFYSQSRKFAPLIVAYLEFTPFIAPILFVQFAGEGDWDTLLCIEIVK